MRTRTLIQVGGLAGKSGLLDRIGIREGLDLQAGGPEAMAAAAILLGAFVELVEGLSGENVDLKLKAWRAIGVRAFRQDEQ